MSGVHLRPATPGDAATIVAVLHAAFEEVRGRLDPPSGAHAESVGSVARRLAVEAAALALVDGVVAGCVFYEHRPDHTYFSRLAVLPAYRRRGLARRLIEHVEEQARAAGRARVRLAVRLALPLQRASYERLGYRFVEYGTHAGYPAPTYAVLEKELTPEV